MAFTDQWWLQFTFDTLMRSFNQVGIRGNILKTVGMMFQPFRAARVRADKSYTRLMTREGRIFKESHQERVIFPECGKEFSKGSMVEHRQTQHGLTKGGSGKEGGKEVGGEKTRTFRMTFPAKAGPRPCPVDGCSGRVAMWTSIWVHFWHQTSGTPWLY